MGDSNGARRKFAARREEPEDGNLNGEMGHLSITEEVKLRESENPWRPRWLQRRGECDVATMKTNDLLRKFRSVLNKMTPDNFGHLIEQVKVFEIDTGDRLDGCIKILFEKAITEPNFAHMYAQMCSVLGTIISAGTNGNRPNFKRRLIAQCQVEFEKHHSDEKRNGSAMAESNANGGEDQVDGNDEFQYALEDKQTKIRKRALGTVRFIGELFKQEQLTCNIMYSCVNVLLGDEMLHEESIECLCKLLTTIGAEMEKDPVKGRQGMNQFFTRLQEIADRKSTVHVCNRIRFMILDVIELRTNKWQPRRVQAAPKKMDEIQKEVETEENKNRILNFVLPEHGRGGNSRHGCGRNHGQDGGRTFNNGPLFPRSNGSMRPPAVRSIPTFDPSRLNLPQNSTENTRLGSAAMFQGWGNNNASPQPTDNQPEDTPPPSYFGSGGSGGSGGGRRGGGGGRGGLGNGFGGNGPSNGASGNSCGSSNGGRGRGNKRSDGGGDGDQRPLYNGRNSSRYR